MKKKTMILWAIFLICVVITVALWFAMNNSEIQYEEVKAMVISSSTKQLKNKKTGSTYNSYEVKVTYNGETYDLKNAHSSYEYPEGKMVKAYLSNGNLYANVEGIKSTTPVAIAYFAFLFGSIAMLVVALMNTGKKAKNKDENTKIENN